MEEYQQQIRLKVDELLRFPIEYSSIREALFIKKMLLQEIKVYSVELLSRIPNLKKSDRSLLMILYAREVRRFLILFKTL
jgi:hypothetical protein